MEAGHAVEPAEPRAKRELCSVDKIAYQYFEAIDTNRENGMTLLPLSLRCQVVGRALRDDAFRKLLLADPKAAIQEETGLALPASISVGVLQEDARTWAFVAPAKPFGPGDLPDPGSETRYVLENLIFQALARDPLLWERAQSSPFELMLSIDAELPPGVLFYMLPGDTVLMRQETDNQIWLTLHFTGRDFHHANDDELPDELLELVSAGGRSPCNTDDSRYGDSEDTNDQTRTLP
jgi:hypothetical protein